MLVVSDSLPIHKVEVRTCVLACVRACVRASIVIMRNVDCRHLILRFILPSLPLLLCLVEFFLQTSLERTVCSNKVYRP